MKDRDEKKSGEKDDSMTEDREREEDDRKTWIKGTRRFRSG